MLQELQTPDTRDSKARTREVRAPPSGFNWECQNNCYNARLALTSPVPVHAFHLRCHPLTLPDASISRGTSPTRNGRKGVLGYSPGTTWFLQPRSSPLS